MRTRSVEYLLASLMIVWGIKLLLPANTFAAPQYRFLAALAREEVWGSFSVCVGGLRVLALYVNGTWRRTPLIRCFGAVFGIIWWLVLGLLLWFTSAEETLPAGVMFYPVFVYFEALSCFRSGFDADRAGAFRSTRKV